MQRKEFVSRIKKSVKKDSETLAKKGVEKVEKVVGKTEENVVKIATDAVYQFYKNTTKGLSAEEKGEFLNEFTNLLLQSKDVEKNEEVAVEFINTMLKKDEVPTEYVLDSAKELSDTTLTQLTEEDELPIDDRRKLIRSMDNETIKTQQLEKLRNDEEKRLKKTLQKERKILQRIYNECSKDTTDNELVLQIDRAMKNIKHLSKKEIDNIKIRIIAKKIAQNYFRFGSVKLKILSEIMSARNMINLGIINLTEEESIKLNNGKEGQFSYKGDLERRLNKEIQEDYFKYDEENELRIIKEMLNKFPKEEKIDMIEYIKEIVQNKAKQINKSTIDKEER